MLKRGRKESTRRRLFRRWRGRRGRDCREGCASRRSFGGSGSRSRRGSSERSRGSAGNEGEMEVKEAGGAHFVFLAAAHHVEEEVDVAPVDAD